MGVTQIFTLAECVHVHFATMQSLDFVLPLMSTCTGTRSRNQSRFVASFAT